MTTAVTAVLAAIVLLATNVGAMNPREEDLSLYSEGAAAYYGQSYDYGGWDRIIARHMAWGHGDPTTFRYDEDGHYCVHPDFGFGSVLTVRNSDTGATFRCTVADAVAPQDQANWRSKVVIEMSWSLFRDLGLDSDNHVEVWYLEG